MAREFAPFAWGAQVTDDLAADLVVEEVGFGSRPGEVHVQVRPSHVPSGAQAVYGDEGPHGGAPWPLDMQGIDLDWFQAAASRCNERRQSVLVAAPTSAGKTVVALHAIQRCLATKAACAYTAPVKALSNQKYLEFCAQFGADKVCLLTGDVTAGNPEDASIVVMTTEVLVSMLHRGASQQSALLEKLHTVVFDEVHYIADEERGTAWEEAILLLERNVCLVCLSATVANYVELAGWLAQTQHAPCHAVFTKYRPVPLEHRIFPCPPACTSVKVADSQGRFQKKGLEILENLPATGGKADEDRRGQELKALLEECRKQRDLPVLVFSFSRAECARFARELAVNVRLPADTAREVKVRVQELLSKPLKKEDQQLQSIRECADYLLPRGVGMHHGGLLPILREVTEMLFKEGLIKVLFTTETFALGVNMPSRAVIFNFASGREFRKFDGHGNRRLKAGEYIQISGRAGRRNIDPHGRAISILSHSVPVGFLQKLVKGRAEKVESRLKLSYGLILRCLRWSRGTLELMLMQSLKQFQSRQVEPVLRSEEEKKLALLQKLGLLDSNFKLTSEGEAAAHVHVATDDLVAIGLLLDGVVDDVDSDTFIAFLSCLVNDTEETEEVQTPPAFDPLWSRCEQQVQRIGALQREHGLEPPSDDARLRQIRSCSGMAEAVLLWQKGETFEKASIAAGGPEQDGLLARVLRRTHALAREFELALRILGQEEQASKVKEAHHRLYRGGRDFQALPFLESIYLPVAVDPNTLEKETLQKATTPCPHQPGSIIMIDPAEIGFSHISVAAKFRDGHTIRESVIQLLRGGRKRDIAHEMVEVYWVDGQFFTLANRRLTVFRLFAQHCPERGKLIKVKVVDDARALAWHWDRKFTTGLWRGWRARVRGTGELIGRTAEETSFNLDLPDLPDMSADLHPDSSETGFARAAKDMPDDADSTLDGEDGDDLHMQACTDSDDEDDGICDIDSSLIIEDNSIAVNPRRVIEFVLERQLGDDAPCCLAIPASTRDLLNYSDSQDTGTSPLIPDRCANIHEYLRNFALPLLDELREDLRSKLEPRELKSEDLRRAERVRLVPYDEALRQAQKGDVPRLPRCFPYLGSENSCADAVVLLNCKQAADLAPYQVVLLFEQDSLWRATAITDAGAPAIVPGLEAEPGGLQIAHDDCYRFGIVYTTPKSKQAVVCVGRRSFGPISAKHRIEINYPDIAAATGDIAIMQRGSIRTAQRVRDDGLAAKAGVRPGSMVVEMEGWDGTAIPLAISQSSGAAPVQSSPNKAHPVRIVFEGEDRRWCFVPLGCNANTNVRVAEALSTPDLHHPIFWQNEISGNPLGDSSAWSGVSKDQCTSLGTDSEYDQDLRAAGLNESQRAAIVEVVTCKDGVKLIQGPPGTGKTQTLVVLLNLTAKLGLAEQVNRCLVCAPTNIAVREIAQRLVERLAARDTFTKALLSQVALIAMEDRAKISNSEDDVLSQVLLDHRKKRIKRVARFWLAESFDHCARTHLMQFPWVWEGVDPLTALLVDAHRAHGAVGCRLRLSEFVRSALADIKSRVDLQKQQLEADFPFETTVFELPPRKRAEAVAQRLERRIYEDLCRLRKALAKFSSCLEKFLPHLSQEVAASLDRSKGCRARPEAAAATSSGESSSPFSKHAREAACRWAPLAARCDPEATEGLMKLLGLSNSERSNLKDGLTSSCTGPSNMPTQPTEEDLKRALNKFRLLIHPDKAPAEMQTLATESFKYLDDAFNAVRRRACGKSSGTPAATRLTGQKREKRSRQPGPIDEALQQECAKTALQKLEEALQELQDASLYVRSADSQALRNTCLRRCVLVMSTVTVAGRSSVAGQRIPTVFVDEACQSCEAETLIALRSDVQRLFLIGDPRQLPATVSSSLAKRAKYERSMFERLEYIGLAPLMLTEQYRMKPSILVWSNMAFYNNEISTASCVLERNRIWIETLGLDRLPEQQVHSRHELGSFRLFNTAGKNWNEEPVGHSLRNVNEGKKLLSMLFKFIAMCPSDSAVTIGIITPYRAQVEFFEEQLANNAGKKMVDRLRSCTTVATVDGFQGNERDIIAISAVRSGKGLIGFSGDERRLNVAVTRARQHVWIVGDLQTLEHGPSIHGAVVERQNVWQHLVPFARERGWVIDLMPTWSPSSAAAEPTEAWAKDLCKEGPWMEMRSCPEAGYPCPYCLLCSCWGDYGHIGSRAHLDARRSRGVEFARGRAITVDLHLEPDESESGVVISLKTGHGLVGDWVCIQSIAEGAALHRYNSNAQPELRVPVGAWILEANGLVDEVGIQAALAGEVDVELTVCAEPPLLLPSLPPRAIHETSRCSADENLIPCYIELDAMNPWYKHISNDGPWIKPFWKDEAVHLRCMLCGAWADDGHLESRRHKEARIAQGSEFVQTDRPPPPPPPPPPRSPPPDAGTSTLTSRALASSAEVEAVSPMQLVQVSTSPCATVHPSANNVTSAIPSTASVPKPPPCSDHDVARCAPKAMAENGQHPGSTQTSGVLPPPPPPPTPAAVSYHSVRSTQTSCLMPPPPPPPTSAAVSYHSVRPSVSSTTPMQSPTSTASSSTAGAPTYRATPQVSQGNLHAAGVSHGPLKSGNVFWLSLPDGQILCIADDGSAESQTLWQCAHGEMESALGETAIIEHCDPQLPSATRNHNIALALQNTEHAFRHFCVASARGMAACGIGDRAKVRERVAKASIAVAVQLRRDFKPSRLQTLLPLAQQCAAVAPQRQFASIPPSMDMPPARARQSAPVAPQMQSRPQAGEQRSVATPAAATALVPLEGPLQPESIRWLHRYSGPILCIADDYTERAQNIWQRAHDEMQYALGGATASIVDRSSPQMKSSTSFREFVAAVGIAFAHRPFCMASSNGLFACGVGNSMKVRERAAKAALAVTVALKSGSPQTYLQTLLPLARQCEAAQASLASHGQHPDEQVRSEVMLAPARPLRPPPPPAAASLRTSAGNAEEDFEEEVDV